MASTNIGKTKRSTDDMINDAIDRQQSWLENRRAFTRNFLKRFNVFAKPETKSTKSETKKVNKENKNHVVLKSYWFPILCALLVILIAVFVIFPDTLRAPTMTVS